jgi:hypothetical protein
MKGIHILFAVAVGFLPAMAASQSASADDSTAALRAELEGLRVQYEARIEALEQRLSAMEQRLAQQQAQTLPPTQEPISVPPGSLAQTVTVPPAEPVPVAPGARSTASSGSEFNPAIGVILNGAARYYEKDPGDYTIPGVPTGGEAGLADEGLSIGESEFVFTASVDDWFASRATLSLEQEEGDFNASLEEAFIDTLSLPANTALRFGRFYSAIGYLNDKHSHTWDFSDQALPYAAFLGSQYTDDGIRFSWLAPTDLYLELGAEVFRGSNYPAAGDAHNGFGTQTLYAHIGGDVGMSNSWTAGLSWLTADARERSSGDEDDPLDFNGSTDLYIADFVWKWAPNGNIRERNLIFQTEYLWRDENGTYLVPDLGNPAPVDTGTAGWYAQLIYQWRPQWRAGVRIDGLNLDDPGNQFVGTPLDTLGDDPLRYTLMFDYSHSEFSRIRLQFERDEAGAENDNQITLQYIMSIGAHGAHEF